MDKENETEQLDFIDDLDSPEEYKEKASIFSTLWEWVEKNVYRTNRLKGWLTLERRNGELVALLHSEVSELLEYLRHDNPPSDHIPDISGAEEECADIIIRLMDIGFMNKWNIPKALFLKMAYNKTRPYRHGGKKL